ncbi:hypothetical protein TanjilG_09166 [Lupinus angustifolius]|uniref:Potassium channel domain-containing protein n=1 Tax=Lupinus angustifolius TaxID=3871 RepID=A0A1J7J1G0_LUPAN|nr:PREDICTED: two-pore potassium channel 3-like [Lupinus angustifolius]OIW18972.1 hypothetical protein TanjilG_09166 [Lupinus angustifolius]
MEKEPLLPHLSLLSAKSDEINISVNPMEFKDRLIFGPSSKDSSSSPPLVEAKTVSFKPSYPNQEILFDPQQKNISSCLSNPDHGCQKPSLHRSKTAPARTILNDLNQHQSEERPHFGTQSIVLQAFVFLVLYLSLGVVIYWFNRHNFSSSETHPIVDGLYFCIVTMCTIGYGDITPNTTTTKLFAILFVLIGFGFIDILLSGMVSFVLDLQENYLLQTVKGRGQKNGGSYLVDVKKGRMRIRLKVALALGVVVLCIGFGVGVLHFVERLDWLDSFYLSVMSVTTVGYGDKAFKTIHGRIFAAIWLLVSTLAVARAFLYLAEARIDKRHRMMAKWILGQDMTVSEFLAADIDNDGFVSKSEYVVYKLKELGKVSDKDIMEVSETFDRLDSGNFGKIKLMDLMETHHS